MKKGKGNQASPNEKEKGTTIADLLDSGLAGQLKKLKKDKEEELNKKKEEELARKREEAKQREKNKTFEELLSESSMDWRKFK